MPIFVTACAILISVLSGPFFLIATPEPVGPGFPKADPSVQIIIVFSLLRVSIYSMQSSLFVVFFA